MSSAVADVEETVPSVVCGIEVEAVEGSCVDSADSFLGVVVLLVTRVLAICEWGPCDILAKGTVGRLPFKCRYRFAPDILRVLAVLALRPVWFITNCKMVPDVTFFLNHI